MGILVKRLTSRTASLATGKCPTLSFPFPSLTYFVYVSVTDTDLTPPFAHFPINTKPLHLLHNTLLAQTLTSFFLFIFCKMASSSSSTAPTQSPSNPEGPSFSDFGITDSGFYLPMGFAYPLFYLQLFNILFLFFFFFFFPHLLGC